MIDVKCRVLTAFAVLPRRDHSILGFLCVLLRVHGSYVFLNTLTPTATDVGCSRDSGLAPMSQQQRVQRALARTRKILAP